MLVKGATGEGLRYNRPQEEKVVRKDLWLLVLILSLFLKNTWHLLDTKAFSEQMLVLCQSYPYEETLSLAEIKLTYFNSVLLFWRNHLQNLIISPTVIYWPSVHDLKIMTVLNMILKVPDIYIKVYLIIVSEIKILGLGNLG